MPRRTRSRRPAAIDLATLPEAPPEWQTPESRFPLHPPTVDRIVAHAIDHRSVHVHWTLTPESVARARASLDGPSRLVLRIYVGGEESGAARLKAYPATEWIGARTVKVGSRGDRVVAAVGFETGGGFAHVARASAVRLLRAGPGEAPISMSDGATPESDVAALNRFSMGRARPGLRFVDLGALR